MTLKRRDANGQTSAEDLRNYASPTVWPRSTIFAAVPLVVEECACRKSDTPTSQRGTQLLGPIPTPTYSLTKFGTVTPTGSSMCQPGPIPRGGAQASPKFWYTSYKRAWKTTTKFCMAIELDVRIFTGSTTPSALPNECWRAICLR